MRPPRWRAARAPTVPPVERSHAGGATPAPRTGYPVGRRSAGPAGTLGRSHVRAAARYAVAPARSPPAPHVAGAPPWLGYHPVGRRAAVAHGPSSPVSPDARRLRGERRNESSPAYAGPHRACTWGKGERQGGERRPANGRSADRTTPPARGCRLRR